jgi:hypothetical protein
LATKSAVAAFGLYMPTQSPTPTDPYEIGDYQVPEIDRHHHYIWMYEYRQIASHVDRRTDTLATTKGPLSVTKFEHFW